MADTKTRPTRPAEPAVIYEQLVAEFKDGKHDEAIAAERAKREQVADESSPDGA
jgi:hypothetical protein